MTDSSLHVYMTNSRNMHPMKRHSVWGMGMEDFVGVLSWGKFGFYVRGEGANLPSLSSFSSHPPSLRSSSPPLPFPSLALPCRPSSPTFP